MSLTPRRDHEVAARSDPSPRDCSSVEGHTLDSDLAAAAASAAGSLVRMDDIAVADTVAGSIGAVDTAADGIALDEVLRGSSAVGDGRVGEACVNDEGSGYGRMRVGRWATCSGRVR